MTPTQRPTIDQLRMIATDYDGTLLGDGRLVSDRTRGALATLDGSHIEFVVITGRPPRFCDNILDQTAIKTTLICANGAVGYDPISREVSQFAKLDLATAHQIVNDLRRELPEAGFCAEMGASFVAERRWLEHAGRSTDEHVDDLRPHLDERVHKLLVSLPNRTPDEALIEVSAVVGDQANIMHAGLPFIELMPPGVDKAFGLERLCTERGIKASEVMTFGDMPNDVAMLKWSGWGVAVGNAHDLAKAAADEVTASNLDHGVAEVIEQLLA